MQNSQNLENGFIIVDAENFGALTKLQSQIYALTKKIFQIEEPNPSVGFNNFHKLINISDAELNSKRLELIKEISSKCNASELIFEAFEKQITFLLGADILAQKSTNLVLQPPGDGNPSELHRDAPANSPYEIVVWVPLVNCYKTKAMYILDSNNSKKAIKFLDDNINKWDEFEKLAKSLSINKNINFGQALIFFTGCLHGSEVNSESETRVSLNIRYKNLFSPSGLKNSLQFFSPIRISSLTKLASTFEYNETLK